MQPFKLVRARLDQAHNGCDNKARARRVGWHAAQDLNARGVEAHLLLCFTQRRGDRVCVAWLATPTRKADLAGVLLQMGGALRQQHRRLVAHHQRHEHGRRNRIRRLVPTLDLDIWMPDRWLLKALHQRRTHQALGMDGGELVVVAQQFRHAGIDCESHDDTIAKAASACAAAACWTAGGRVLLRKNTGQLAPPG